MAKKALVILWLVVAVAWLGGVAGGTGRLKNYDIWKDLPSKTLMEMGGRFYSNVQPDSALVCYNIVANRYFTNPNGDELTLRMESSAMNQLGILYIYYFVDYEKAHKYLLQAEKIAKENRFTSILSSVYTNLGNIYIIDCSLTRNGELDHRTIEMHQKAFETALESNKPDKIIISAVNMAHLADDSITLQALRDDIKQFLNYQIPDSLRQYEYAKDYCRAALEVDKGNLEAALVYYNKTLQHVYHENARTCEIIRRGIMNTKARLLIRLDHDQEAVDIINSYIDQANKNDDHHGLFISYQALSEFYHNFKKDSIQGDRFELMALREKDIVLNQNKLLDAQKTEFLFQIDEINAEVQELSTRQRITKIIAWSIAALVLVVLTFLYLLWRKYKQEQEKNRKLYENNLALLAAEDERRQQIIEQQQAPKYQSHQVAEGEQSDLLHRILYVMETSEEIYDNDFSLERLTELVDATSKNYISQVLNGHYHQSFPSIVNEYRIREACRRINAPEQYGHLTVEGIAQSVGFGSYPNFVTNFKRFTGLTPSAYRKQHNAQSHADSAD
ncbi:MAG: helix-turn-helix transcriptional regulator [Muribaculaceae bacterium]|nr:helix-turn-helix transcriptional regulator [Muribaculaceae bacterium]